MATTTNVVLPNTYRDSVVLMRIGRQMEKWHGVEQATAMMGTPNNLILMESAGLLSEDNEGIGPNDLVLAVRVSDRAILQDVAERARALLTAETSAIAVQEEYRPSTIDGALKEIPAANLAVISVPGDYAAYEAGTALSRGLNVFVFSDFLSHAYETIIWPVVGFFFLPLTTLAYAAAINWNGQVTGVYFFMVLGAALMDLGVVGGAGYGRRRMQDG